MEATFFNFLNGDDSKIILGSFWNLFLSEDKN